MPSLREMKDREYIPHKTYLKLLIGGGLSLIKVLITNPVDLKKLRNMSASEKRYIRPKRPYELPSFKDGMKCGVTEEKYLRPTLYCNPCAPEVIALAHHLGAFQKTDREYAETAFEFVKEKLDLEICPMDTVEETIRRGTGTCFHLISVFIALCRCAGIKARYKTFAMTMIQTWYDATAGSDQLVKKWYDQMGFFMMEGEGEAFVDGKWIAAHVGPTAERQVAGGVPITKFGESSIGVWFFAVPGTTENMESIPYGLGAGANLLKRIAPGSMERVNISIQHQNKLGKKIIEDAGGKEAYDTMARKKRGSKAITFELSDKKEIVFGE